MNTFGKINWLNYYGCWFKVDDLLGQNPCTKCARGENGANNCTHTLNPDSPTSCFKFVRWVRMIWPVVTGKAANPLCKNEKAAKVK